MKNKDKNVQKNTLIGAGTVLDGTFDIEYDVRVDGVLRGERLATREVLTVCPEGEVQTANIEVAEAHVDGKVVGMLKATRRVHLNAGSRFMGTLQTPKLVIEEGASLVEAEVAGRAGETGDVPTEKKTKKRGE